MREAFLFCICGRKNTGKTTLLRQLIKEFSRRGITTATIKHDGHQFDEEPEETDTRRHRDAGAIGSAVFSGDKLMLVKKRSDSWSEEEAAYHLAEAFPEAQLVLVEGLKNSRLPKIELVRTAFHAVSNPQGRIGLVADAVNIEWWKEKEAGNVWSYEESAQICDMILETAKQTRRVE